MRFPRMSWPARVGAVAVAGAAIAGCGGSGDGGTNSGTTQQASSKNPYHLIKPGELTVGLNLDNKPERWLDHGKPAGYDVVLAQQLARDMGVRLKLKNLSFDGLIPGLQAHQFDIISTGLSNTPERQKIVTFTRPYVPYQEVLAVPASSTTPAVASAWNKGSMKLAALQGSVDEQAAKQHFPQAHVISLRDNDSAMLDVATGRANAALLESFFIGPFNDSSPKKLKALVFPTNVLPVYYGSYAVQKGNTALARYVSKWICTNQANGFLARSYQSTEGSKLPPMPKCP